MFEENIIETIEKGKNLKNFENLYQEEYKIRIGSSII